MSNLARLRLHANVKRCLLVFLCHGTLPMHEVVSPLATSTYMVCLL